MLGSYWVPSREKLVTEIETASVTKALTAGYSVVIDATNFNNSWPQLYDNGRRDKVFGVNVSISIQDFSSIPLQTCIDRDSKRGIEMVGEKVIMGMYNKYLKGRYAEDGLLLG